jgi:hypothetical protein
MTETSVQTTIAFRPSTLRRLLELAEGGTDLSELVNEAVEARLREDALDAETIRRHRGGPTRSLAAFRDDLEREGLI